VANLYVSHRVPKAYGVLKTSYFKLQIILSVINEGCSRIFAVR